MNFLRKSIYLFSSLVFCPQIMLAQKKIPVKPNILFILIDDLGKEWISTYGAENIETPVFDSLSKTGITFTNCYSMPQSTPSRVCLLTGQYPYRNGWVNHWDAPRWGAGAHFDETCNPSIPDMIRKSGYVTAVAGKWQLDDFRVEPDAMNRVGFDEYCMWTGYETGVPESKNRYWDPYIHTKSGSKIYQGGFGEDIFSNFLIDFMRKHGKGDKPMFMYYPMCLAHTPLTSTPHEPNVKGKMECHKAMVRYVDYTIGKLVYELEHLGLRENTVIVVTTDNGTSGDIIGKRNGMDIAGGKSKTTEAGINAPLVISCPSFIDQNVITDVLVDFTDFFPTFAEMAEAKLLEEYIYDGKSFYPYLKGETDYIPRSWIMGMGGHNNAKVSKKGVENQYVFRDRVIRDKQYKLYISPKKEPVKLFDLLKDPYEKNNIIGEDEMTSVIEKLQLPLESMFKQDSDPTYNPNPAQEWDIQVSVESQTWKINY